MTTGFTLDEVTYTLTPVTVADTGVQVGWDLLDGAGVRITSFVSQNEMVRQGLGREPILEEAVALKLAIDFVSSVLGELTERRALLTQIEAALGAESAATLKDLEMSKLREFTVSLTNTAAKTATRSTNAA
jgi:hypothetical protein